MENFEKRLEDHMDHDNRNFDRLTAVLEKFSLIEERVDSIDRRLAKSETNLEWLMKAFWTVVIPLATGLVTAVLYLILHK